MKKSLLLAIGITVLTIGLGSPLSAKAQDKGTVQLQEYAIIKWDGSDKVCVNLPGKSEIIHVFELSGTKTPKDMQEEEFCLAWAANKLAKDGLQVVAFDSRRLVFHRPATSK